MSAFFLSTIATLEEAVEEFHSEPPPAAFRHVLHQPSPREFADTPVVTHAEVGLVSFIHAIVLEHPLHPACRQQLVAEVLRKTGVHSALLIGDIVVVKTSADVSVGLAAEEHLRAENIILTCLYRGVEPQVGNEFPTVGPFPYHGTVSTEARLLSICIS